MDTIYITEKINWDSYSNLDELIRTLLALQNKLKDLANEVQVCIEEDYDGCYYLSANYSRKPTKEEKAEKQKLAKTQKEARNKLYKQLKKEFG